MGNRNGRENSRGGSTRDVCLYERETEESKEKSFVEDEDKIRLQLRLETSLRVKRFRNNSAVTRLRSPGANRWSSIESSDMSHVHVRPNTDIQQIRALPGTLVNKKQRFFLEEFSGVMDFRSGPKKEGARVIKNARTATVRPQERFTS